MADKLGFIQEKDIADFARLMRDYRAGRLFSNPNGPTPVNQPSQRWMPCVNNTTSDIPSYGVCSIVGANFLGTTQSLLDIQFTTSHDSYAGTIAINAGAEIKKNGGRGLVTFDCPTWARVSSSSEETAKPGCTLYLLSGGFELSNSASDLFTQQTNNIQLLSELKPVSGGYIGLVNITTALPIIAKLDEELSSGGYATASIWTGIDGTIEDTGIDITVYDWLLLVGDTSLPTLARVIAQYIDGNWVVVQASCGADEEES